MLVVSIVFTPAPFFSLVFVCAVVFVFVTALLTIMDLALIVALFSTSMSKSGIFRERVTILRIIAGGSTPQTISHSCGVPRMMVRRAPQTWLSATRARAGGTLGGERVDSAPLLAVIEKLWCLPAVAVRNAFSNLRYLTGCLEGR
ncbi:hypothetical protein PLEOSDRAFT_1098471 [Pleurotus ostreatus PC15]|uniref:Uncharacterized protein n=1 Tax=Pleurotus ostreatus (strain PC15) TaxID=1137138 RepID=A0A067NZQ6_PLEO1|nr:hypothetical protein PLEOSDRAFT_1098471 [Pleurotus ostreatus PC15]